MKGYLAEAKRQGLNWQTLLIEDTESDLKAIIKHAVLNSIPFFIINNQVEQIVNAAVADIEIPELRLRSRRGLLNFATVEYRKTASVLRPLNILLFSAAVAVLSDTATAKERQNAAATILKHTPTLAGALPIGTPTAGTTLKHADYIEIAQPLKEFSKAYMQRVENAFQNLAGSSAKDDIASNVSLRNVSEMIVRQERHQDEMAELKGRGVKLVWISTHANCSKRCAAAQGKLYSLDGTSGKIDGVSYIPLERVTNVPYVTKSGKTYINGIISGFNCRHYLIEYAGGNRPIDVPADVVAKYRTINDTQRAMERTVRFNKDMAIAYRGVDDAQYKKYRARAIVKNREYIAYSKRNNVAYYPSRTKVFEGETNI